MSTINKADEIDYREIFNKIWASKLQFLLITIVIWSIPFFYHVISPPIYTSSFSVDFGSHKKVSGRCSPGDFGIFRCSSVKNNSYSPLYSLAKIKEFNSDLERKFISVTNMNFIFYPSSNSINIKAISTNKEELNKKISEVILEIQRLIAKKDDEVINQIISKEKKYIDSLMELNEALKNSTDETGLIKSKVMALGVTIKDKKSMISDKALLKKSKILPSKNTLKKLKLKDTVFSLFLGFFISILVILYRAREKVNL